MAFRFRTLALASIVSCLVGAGAAYIAVSGHVAELDRAISDGQVAQATARAQYRSDLARLGGDVTTAQERASIAERRLGVATNERDQERRNLAEYRSEVGRVIEGGRQFAHDSLRSGLTNLELIDRCLDDFERYLESLDRLRRLGGQTGG